MQTLQIVPADGATDGLKVASVGDKPSQGLAVGGKSCFQISDGENLGGCRHEQNDQDVLTFGLDRSFRLLPGSLMEQWRPLVLAEQDLVLFLDKVAQLQKLVSSLETDQQRRQSLAGCSDHNQVVALARSWGFEIGRRWGEPAPAGENASTNNIFRGPLPAPGHDRADLLAEGQAWHLMLISSNASSASEQEWIDPAGSLWMLLLRGSARLQLGTPEDVVDLSVGDHLLISPRRPYRLLRTDPPPGTLRLELHWRA